MSGTGDLFDPTGTEQRDRLLAARDQLNVLLQLTLGPDQLPAHRTLMRQARDVAVALYRTH